MQAQQANVCCQIKMQGRATGRKWSSAAGQHTRCEPDGRKWASPCTNRDRLRLAGVGSRLAAHGKTS